jgi:hypothetical protein
MIDSIQMITQALGPTRAEAVISSDAADGPANEAATLSGRLVGPQCLLATTVEVAYALRPLPTDPANPRRCSARVIVPEPSLWAPETPFLYRAHVLRSWAPGPVVLDHGFRRFALSPSGFLLNGQPIVLRAARCSSLTDTEARDLRQAGINTLLAPIEATEVQDQADRWGFLVFGPWSAGHKVEQARALRRHASWAGWVLPSGTEIDDALVERQREGDLVGCEGPSPSGERPLAVRFVVVPEGDPGVNDLPQITLVE